MQINLPSRSCIRDSQEADTPTHGRSHGLWQRHGEEEEISCLMLLVNFVVLHLLLCFNQWNAKKGEQQGGREQKGRKRTNECKIKDESVCLWMMSWSETERVKSQPLQMVYCLWVCVDCVSVLGWCCSGKEGTCIFAIKLLPMHSHRGRNHSTMATNVICWEMKDQEKKKPNIPVKYFLLLK